MSVDVLREVFRESQSRGVARNVLTVLADAAHPDGVTWLPIEPSRKKESDPTKCIVHRANASPRAIKDAIKELAALGELEVRRAQRGNARINVYRIVLGALAVADVDYSDVPFTLERPFSNQVQNLHVVSNEETPPTGCSSRTDHVQFSSRPGAVLVSDESSESSTTTPIAASSAMGEASAEPSVEAAAVKSIEGSAAAEPAVTDDEITKAVLAIPGSDRGSPRVVIPIAYGLPRSVFAGVAERVSQRRGGVGLLVDLLRIVRAERTAMLSAQLNAELAQGARRSSRPITTADALKADDPQRYVRIMAKAFPADTMRQALEGCDDVEALMTLHEQIVAGAESDDRLGTAEQERTRWVEARASDHSFPIDEIHVVIDTWNEIDDVERDELHELADQRRLQPEERAA